MDQDRIDRVDVERSILRLRLAGVALGATLVMLSPQSDQIATAAVLLGYVAAIVIQRFAPARRAASGGVAVAIDVLYAAGLSFLLPLSVGTWALYAFAIGTSAIEFGAVGAAVATAAAILAYDLGIGLRSEELRPSDLWPVQLLLAIGLLVAELVWAVGRGEAARRRLGSFALAQRDLIAAPTEVALLDRLTDHAVRTFGARSAWVEADAGAGAIVRHERGSQTGASAPTRSWVLDDAVGTKLRCAFADELTAERVGAVIRDLATDAAPLLLGLRVRARLAHGRATLAQTLDGVRGIERDRAVNAVLAEVLSATTAIAGPAALIRPSDGSVLAGDLDPGVAVAMLRDTTPPALVRDRSSGRVGAVVHAGHGLALVVSGSRQDLVDDDLRALAILGESATAASERIAERDAFIARAEALDRRVVELAEQVRARDDAVASAVHELRTPLTSVHAYAQLTSRNLQAVQQQVKQLDRLIADLLRRPGGTRIGLELETVDLLHEARQAGRRAALVSGREIHVDADGDGAFTVAADRSRVEQVLQNLLSNAVKFSPPDQEIEVELRRGEGEVVLAVTDRGAGIPADELQRIFERYYRGVNQRRSVSGEGIGLAIAREIVVAHGGRIWAASDGPGKGSTLFVALPVVQPETVPQPVESAGGRRLGDEAPHPA